MRVDVLRWDKTTTDTGIVVFRARTIKTYLAGEELAQYGFPSHLHSTGVTMRCTADVRYMRDGSGNDRLREQIDAQLLRQENAKTQAKGKLMQRELKRRKLRRKPLP